MDRLSLFYVTGFSFLYTWEQVFVYKLLSHIILGYIIVSDVAFWVIRLIYLQKFRSRKQMLFQETFPDLYDLIDRKVEDSIKRSFFSSPIYIFFSRKTTKNILWKYFKVLWIWPTSLNFQNLNRINVHLRHMVHNDDRF